MRAICVSGCLIKNGAVQARPWFLALVCISQMADVVIYHQLHAPGLQEFNAQWQAQIIQVLEGLNSSAAVDAICRSPRVDAEIGSEKWAAVTTLVAVLQPFSAPDEEVIGGGKYM